MTRSHCAMCEHGRSLLLASLLLMPILVVLGVCFTEALR